MENNKLDTLAEELFNELEKNKDIFKTKIVLIPSLDMEKYLKAYFLKHYQKVLMNVKFLPFTKAVLEIFDTNFNIAKRNEIISLIMKIIIDELVKSEPHLPTKLKSYLPAKLESHPLDSQYGINGIKLLDVSKELASYFNECELNSLEIQSDYKYIYDKLLELLKESNLTTIGNIKNLTPKENLEIYSFGFIKENIPSLYNEILNQFRVIRFDLISKGATPELFITKVPNRIREIENLHSTICKIILSDSSVKFSDFLVMGPNIIEYESDIERVFNQEGEYPNIPYYISAPKTRNNYVLNALNTLHDIISKGFFTRLDFDNLINNNAIQFVRGITDDDIDSWENAIVDMNAYRKEDWEYAKRRLLVSKICGVDDFDNIVSLYNEKIKENKDYIPYTRIGLDDDSIYRFCLMVDDLNSLLEVTKKNEDGLKFISNENTLNEIKNAFDKFLSKADENGIETNGYYRKIYDLFEFIRTNKIDGLPIDSLLFLMIESSKCSTGGVGELFSSGVSFTEFDPNTVLSAKYVFILNASSKNLPKKKTRNPFSDEEINYEKEKNAFNLWTENADKLYISFICRDLKKDEEFFLSNFVRDLKHPLIEKIKNRDSHQSFKEENINKNIDSHLASIDIDETRNKSDIFTLRGKRNKEFHEGLFENTPNINPNIPIDSKMDNEVTVSTLASFLNEPFTTRAKRIIGSRDDIDSDITKEFEIFDLDNLDESKVFKEVALKLLEADSNEKETIKEELKKSFELRNVLPSITPEIEAKAFDDIIESVEELKSLVGEAKIIRDLKTLNLDDFTLTNNNEFLKDEYFDEEPGSNQLCWTYYNIKKIKKDEKKEKENNSSKESSNSEDEKTISYKDIFRLYVISLMDVIKNGNSNESYRIFLCPRLKLPKIITDFTINKLEAEEMLKKIYKTYMDYRVNRFFDAKYLPEDEDGGNKLCDDFKTMVNKLKYTSWEYFNEKRLFDKYTQLGYTNAFFREKNEQEQIMLGLLLCVGGLE